MILVVAGQSVLRSVNIECSKSEVYLEWIESVVKVRRFPSGNYRERGTTHVYIPERQPETAVTDSALFIPLTGKSPTEDVVKA